MMIQSALSSPPAPVSLTEFVGIEPRAPRMWQAAYIEDVLCRERAPSSSAEASPAPPSPSPSRVQPPPDARLYAAAIPIVSRRDADVDGKTFEERLDDIIAQVEEAVAGLSRSYGER
jgi:hypothetical protein